MQMERQKLEMLVNSMQSKLSENEACNQQSGTESEPEAIYYERKRKEEIETRKKIENLKVRSGVSFITFCHISLFFVKLKCLAYIAFLLRKNLFASILLLLTLLFLQVYGYQVILVQYSHFLSFCVKKDECFL